MPAIIERARGIFRCSLLPKSHAIFPAPIIGLRHHKMVKHMGTVLAITAYFVVFFSVAAMAHLLLKSFSAAVLLSTGISVLLLYSYSSTQGQSEPFQSIGLVVCGLFAFTVSIATGLAIRAFRNSRH